MTLLLNTTILGMAPDTLYKAKGAGIFYIRRGGKLYHSYTNLSNFSECTVVSNTSLEVIKPDLYLRDAFNKVLAYINSEGKLTLQAKELSHGEVMLLQNFIIKYFGV